jgi:methylglyoxal/glyoxal reductase
MTLTLQSRVKLNNGVEIPVLGLGVFRAGQGKETQQAIRWALEAGYRHIDTAKVYGNERDVGIAVRDSGLPREELFITTKLWNSDHGAKAAVRACEDSLRALGLEQIDLYLIHWPVERLRLESWKALEGLLRDGKCRAIGVSNYTVRHLDELLAAGLTVPAVDQVEFSPFLYQRELLEHCAKHRIALEAYSPLTKGIRLRHPTVVEVARHHGRTPAQVMIRWCLQRNTIVIPKSTNRDRIRENAQVFDFSLSDNEMARLDGLHEELHTGWDPTDAA